MATPSTSRPRPPSRPTTPLRRSSRSSLGVDPTSTTNLNAHPFPLEHLSPQFAELADTLTDLDTNLMHVQLMQESMSRFCESFSAFLYGLEVNAFCVDFTEAPVPESFGRAERREAELNQVEEAPRGNRWRPDFEADMTFMTNDTSFVNDPRGVAATTTATATATPPPPKRGGIPRPLRGAERGRARGGRRARG